MINENIHTDDRNTSSADAFHLRPRLRETMRLEFVEEFLKGESEEEKQDARETFWAMFDYYLSVANELKELGYFDLPADKRHEFDASVKEKSGVYLG